MSFRTQCMVYLTAISALAASACSAATARPVEAASAQVQCPGGTLRSAADAAAYAGCDSVMGDLRIRQSDLGDLHVLGRLRSVSGTLEISDNPKLDDLTGLEQLTSVGALEIKSNAALETLRGLEGLERADRIAIEHNGIYNMAGLTNLRVVGDLVVANNSKLISLSGLRGLQHAQSVEIRNNPRLAAYSGLLPELQKVERELVLRSNRGLSRSEVREVLERVETRRAEPTLAAREARREASLH